MLSFTWLLLHNKLFCFDLHYYIICDTYDCTHNGDEPPKEQEPSYFHWDLSTDPVLESIQYWVGLPLQDFNKKLCHCTERTLWAVVPLKDIYKNISCDWGCSYQTLKRLKVKGRFMGPFSTAAIGLLYSYPQQVPAFISRGATHHTDAQYLYQRRRELLPMNFASKSVIDESTSFFYMPQSWDMGQILLLPLRRKAYWGFCGRPKNPTASAGFEPANSGTRGQYAKH